jgi:hypothetical protein
MGEVWRMKNVNQINWNELGAPNVPRWLQDLQPEASNSKLFSESYNALWQFLVPDYADWRALLELMKSDVHHQVVPFLIDMLEDEKSASNAGSILDLLDCLARLWFRRKEISDADSNRQLYENWARRINDAVRVGIPVYQKFLNEVGDSGIDIAQGLLDALEETKAK